MSAKSPRPGADPTDHDVPDEHLVHRTGHWLPQDKRHHHKFLHDTISHVDKHPKPLHPVLEEFKEMVEQDSRLYMLFNLMFEQLPANKKYLKDPTGDAQVRDFNHLLQLMNHVLTTAPRWTVAKHKAGMVGVPVNALLDWPMGTRAGFTVFQDPKVNAMMKKVLNVWGEFLKSPESAKVLDDQPEHWFGEHGVSSLEEVANKAARTSHKFNDMFVCDPSDKYHGYKSWDDFFTRELKEGIRPVAGEDNDDIVANACESRFYKLAHNVHARDRFWVKGQPYSVNDMLAFDELAEQFVGGTIYQAFLSALSYHRWHSPVTGTIKKAYVVDGTYFSEPLYEDFTAEHEADTHGECTSQEYISAVATRALVFIEADNPKIGLMCFIGVGMTEVSTCDITVKEGQKVKKGEQLGMFHFGGSSHVILFRKGVKVSGFPDYTEHNVPVRSELCKVSA
ncbi:Phophatidylserine decarboxylase-domain-containing protein [Kockovaella imperatae]|uniref:Phophatidylserine decarboxylase-domain-containing protein n=1 Tax=Kockovaella imperatae TaxID=4999 RepID=A0A1Y1US78_9TREE|nr:Phophatidylserine decarboxylase-domain-containing protein [Kockovaella imperatae]ORX40306.1 Phophatidylserine decarboxylase-domain-containing protein [Kockovaella imperatae]